MRSSVEGEDAGVVVVGVELHQEPDVVGAAGADDYLLVDAGRPDGVVPLPAPDIDVEREGRCPRRSRPAPPSPKDVTTKPLAALRAERPRKGTGRARTPLQWP